MKADVAELYGALLRGRQGGWLSPNDCRDETGFPHVADGDSIEPPTAGGKPADDAAEPPKPAPPVEDDKIAPLFLRGAD